ncbi:MAG: Ig-like domain-containing protein [Gemmatimonadetes bacterium]|nr:Ig-like domain-containing protein [Gemmatimonadota bacterium]
MRLLPRPGRVPAALAAALLPAVLLVAAAAPVLAAQSIAVQVGDSATLTVAPGARVGIPLRVDLSAAGSTLNIASLSGTLSWGTARLTFDSIRVNAATGFTQTTNTAGAATGSAVLSYFSTTRLTASAALATAWFTASTSTGGARVEFAASGAGNEAGTSILAQVVTRALAVCVGSSGRWGDVNDDGTVSIIDAQQIARFSVGLSVASAAAVAARGDVNADNTVSIIDAQQIARFSVGLSAAARINTSLGGGATASTITLAPSSAQTLAVGATVTLVATPRDASNADLTGCAPVTWSSSAAAVATVSASGVVQGVAAGSATITATSGAATASVAVTVGGSGGTAGVSVRATSPVATSRFLVRIDSGGLSAEVVRRFPTTSRTLNQVIPLPAGTGYRVRVYAVDSASTAPDAIPLIGALGVARGVAVSAGVVTTTTVGLVAPTVTVSMPDTVTSAQRAVANVTARYPARAFPGTNNPIDCEMRWASSAFMDNEAGVGNLGGTPGAVTDSTGTCQAQIPAQGTAATLFHQLVVYLEGFTVDSYELSPTITVPSSQRGQALRQLRVRALTTGAVVSFSSTVPARRVYAIAMGGALGTPAAPPDSATMARLRALVPNDAVPRGNAPGAPASATGDVEAVATPLAAAVGVGEVVARLDGNGIRNGTLTVPLPPGSGYDIRVVTVDSASWATDSASTWSWVLGASGRATGITVPATGTVSVPVTLAAPVVTTTWPDSVGVGQAINATFSVTDPADLFAGLTTGFAFTWYGRTLWTRNASGGTQRFVSTSSASPAGSRTWAVSLPSQTTTGVVYLQSSAETFFIDPAGRYVYLDAFDRNLARGQSLRTLRVGVPAAPTCPTTPIALGDSVTGTLATTDCPSQRITGGVEDRYTFTAAASTPVEIRMRSTAFDTYLQVRNAAGVVVFENDDESSTVTNSLLTATLPAGSYTITAGSFEAGSTGAYTLTFRSTGSVPTCAPVPIALGDSVAGTLATTDCPSQRVTGGFEDRYAYTAAASTPVVIALRSGAFDTYLQVRNASGTMVFENDDEPTSTNSLLAVTLPAGSYTITAGSFDPAKTGAYVLTFRRPPPAPATIAYATTGGASVVMLDPEASVNTAVTVRDTTGTLITPAITYTVRDDSVARVVTGGIQARSRSGATPGTFVVAEARALTPVPAESIWVLVPRNATGPVLRTDLNTFRLPATAGTAVTFNVVVDMRNAAQLGAADFDLVFPTLLFYPAGSGSASPVVTPAAGVTVLNQGLTGAIGRIAFSYARPSTAGSANDGLVQIAQVTLYSKGASSTGGFAPFATISLIPGSIFSNSLADLLSQSTAYSYPMVMRAP